MTADPYQLQTFVNEAQQLTNETQIIREELAKHKNMAHRLYIALIAALAQTDHKMILDTIYDYTKENQ